jgi:basic membrane protein A
MKKIFSMIGAFAFTVALVGCAGSGGETPTDEPLADPLYCVISDQGGFEDMSFNQSAWEGLQEVQTKIGAQIKSIQSSGPEDFAPNIDAAVAENCNLIFTVGFNLADATNTGAQTYPDAKFVMIDDTSITQPNVKSMAFATQEAAYLAGYLAAGMSKTGKIGLFGGMALPPVLVFGDGFVQGVEAYNKAKGTNVELLGFNAENPEQSTMVGDFTSQDKAKAIAETMVNQGADILFPGAGGAGLGGIQVAVENDLMFLWSDADGYYTLDKSFIPRLLTTVMKNIRTAVYDICAEYQSSGTYPGNFSNKAYIGTIANGGIGLAPYHDLDAEVPETLKAEIADLEAQMKDGTLVIESKWSPTL